MSEHQPSTTPSVPSASQSKWDLSHGGGIDTDLLSILIQERNFHHEQIMAINGRLGWMILALVASVFLGGDEIRKSFEGGVGFPAKVALLCAMLLLTLSVVQTAFAVVEHWKMRMVWVRRFEIAIQCYTHGKSIENALAAAEQFRSTRYKGPDWKLISGNSETPLPVLFSALPDHRACRLKSFRKSNIHMRFGIAAGLLLLSAACFTGAVMLDLMDDKSQLVSDSVDS